MGLKEDIDALTTTTAIEVFAAGRRVRPTQVRVTLGHDIVAAAADVTLVTVPDWLVLGQPLEIRLGKNGRTRPVFTGRIEEAGAAYFPFTATLAAAGPLAVAQLPHPIELTFASQTDQTIVADLLALCLPDTSTSVQGLGLTLGTLPDHPLVKEAGSPPWRLIAEIDRVTGFGTFDSADGIVRRRQVEPLPSSGGVWDYAEGVNILAVRRLQSIRQTRNAVAVTGLPQPAGTPFAYQFAESDLIPDPPGLIVEERDSDLIETGDVAEEVAVRTMRAVNRAIDTLALTVPGNPYLEPGQTVRVQSGRLGLDAFRPYRIRHLEHTAATGYTTDLVVEGGVGDDGYATDLDPVAAFTYRLTRETYLVGGTPSTRYTVTCDGAASSDPDGQVTRWQWANSANGDVKDVTRVDGVEPDTSYGTAFTDAQLAAGPTVTLTVSDNDLNTAMAVVTIVADPDSTLTRDLYVAAGSRAEATGDGGATWQMWTPGGGVTVVSTPTIAGQDHSYFGLSNGGLYRTDDFLASTPGLVHTFPAQVNCIWIHERNANRVTVGLENGQVWKTTDASALGASVWTMLADYGDPVRDLVESFDPVGQYRVAVGATLRISQDELASDSILTDFGAGAVARQIIPSLVGLPGKITGTATDPVRVEAGAAYTFPAPAPVDVRAGTHHIRQAVLYVADRAGKVYATADDGTAFSHVGTLGAGDPANRLIRDGDNQSELYAAADDGAWKSFASGVGWVQLRDYSAAGLIGLQAGYGDLRVPTVPLGDLFIATSAGLLTRLGVNNYTRIGAAHFTSIGTVFGHSGFPGRLYYYVHSTDALWYSADGGATWTAKTVPPLTGQSRISEQSPGVWYAVPDSGTDLYVQLSHTNFAQPVTNAGIWKSTDNGGTWTRLYTTTIEAAYDTRSEIVRVSDDRFLFTNGGTIRATDNDFASSTELRTRPTSSGPLIRFSAGETDEWFYVAATAAFNRPFHRQTASTDVAIGIGAGGTNDYQHELRQSSAGTVLCLWNGDAGNAIWRSTNGGDDWSLVTGYAEGVSATQGHLAVSLANPSAWLHTGAWPYLFISQDDGVTWGRESLASAVAGSWATGNAYLP